MKIEDQAALKIWLVKTLNSPRYKSHDPDILADYIITLIKNDKSDYDLKEICFRELEVFLSDVSSFVDDLFQYLKLSKNNKNQARDSNYKIKSKDCDHSSSRSWDTNKFKSPVTTNINKKWHEKSQSDERQGISNSRDRVSRRQFFSPPLQIKQRDRKLRKRSYTRSSSRMSVDTIHSYVENRTRASSEGSSISSGSECSAAKRSRIDESSERSISPEPRKSKSKKKYVESISGSRVHQANLPYKGSTSNQNYVPNLSQPPPALAYAHGGYINPTLPPQALPQFPQHNVYAYVQPHPENFAGMPVHALPQQIYASQPPILQSAINPNPYLSTNLYPHVVNNIYPCNQTNVPNSQINVYPPNNLQYAGNIPAVNQYINSQINSSQNSIAQNMSNTIYTANMQNNLQFVNQQNESYTENAQYNSTNPINPQNSLNNVLNDKPNMQYSTANYVINKISSIQTLDTSAQYSMNNATSLQYNVANMQNNSLSNILSDDIEENISYNHNNQFQSSFETSKNTSVINHFEVNPNMSNSDMDKRREVEKIGIGEVVNNRQNLSASDITKNDPQICQLVNTKKSEHPGVSISKGSGFSSNTTLELRKVPKEDNTIANINNHFQKFGIIVNLQVGWDNDPQAALVSFASNAQASAAYKSKEPFLNNRFIKIFWHNQEKNNVGSSGNVGTTTSLVVTNSIAGLIPGQEWNSKAKPVLPQRHQLQLNNTLKNLKPSFVSPPQNLSTLQNLTPSVKNFNQPLFPTSKIEEPAMDLPIDNELMSIANENLESKENEVEMSEIDIVLAVAGHFKKDAINPITGNITASTKSPEIGRITMPELTGNSRAIGIPALTKNNLPTGSNLKINHNIQKMNEVNAKSIEINKQKQNLLNKCLDQQRETLNKLEKDKNTMSVEEKNKYLQMMKSQQEIMDSLRADLLKPVGMLNKPVSKYTNQSTGSEKQVSKYVSPSAFVKPTIKPQSNFVVNRTHKLIRKQDANIGDKKIENTESELPMEMDSKKSTPQASAPPFKMRPKLGRVGRVMDKRPRQLMITGFEAEDAAELISHMAIYGEIESNRFDLTVPCLFVTYKYRQCGEKIMYEGKTFNGQTLQIIWSDGKSSQKPLTMETEAEKLQIQKDDGNLSTIDELQKVRTDSESGISSVITSYSLRLGDRRSSSGSQAFAESDYPIDIGLNEYTSDENSSDGELIKGLHQDEEDEEENEEGRSWRK